MNYDQLKKDLEGLYITINSTCKSTLYSIMLVQVLSNIQLFFFLKPFHFPISVL